MAQLWMTFLDVGWGDSIFLEAEDDAGDHYFGLVDSNDTVNWPTSRVFLKRHFERYADDAQMIGKTARSYPYFDVVIASHAHADHVSGLQGVIRQFGTHDIYISRFNAATATAAANLLRWAKHATRNNIPVARAHSYLSVPDTFTMGPVSFSVHWPPAPPVGSPNAPHDASDENNNSLVLSIKLGKVHFVLTGDCPADNWMKSGSSTAWPISLPSHGVKLVQVPHHGARNGLFDSSGNTPMLQQLDDLAKSNATVDPVLSVSCHPVPHGHPHRDVSNELDSLSTKRRFKSCLGNSRWLRTDKSLHFTLWTDGSSVESRARPPF